MIRTWLQEWAMLEADHLPSQVELRLYPFSLDFFEICPSAPPPKAATATAFNDLNGPISSAEEVKAKEILLKDSS